MILRRVVERQFYWHALRLAWPVQNHPHLLQRNESTAYHLVQSGQNRLNALRIFDNLDNHRQILREAKNFLGVIDACRSVPSYPPQHCCTGESFLAEKLEQCFIERFAVP